MRVARAGPASARTVAASARAPQPPPPQRVTRRRSRHDESGRRATSGTSGCAADSSCDRGVSSCGRGDSSFDRAADRLAYRGDEVDLAAGALPRSCGSTGARRRRSRCSGWATRRTRAVAPEQEHDQTDQDRPDPDQHPGPSREAAAVRLLRTGARCRQHLDGGCLIGDRCRAGRSLSRARFGHGVGPRGPGDRLRLGRGDRAAARACARFRGRRSDNGGRPGGRDDAGERSAGGQRHGRPSEHRSAS